MTNTTPSNTVNPNTVASIAATPIAVGLTDVPLVDGVDNVSSIGDDDLDDDRGTSYPRCADGNGTLSHLFFSNDDYELARAKAICKPCGLKVACLSGALEREEPCGVWGGKIVVDGVPVEFKRKRGRPRKHPKPVLVVDEAPIPAHLVA